MLLIFFTTFNIISHYLAIRVFLCSHKILLQIKILCRINAALFQCFDPESMRWDESEQPAIPNKIQITKEFIEETKHRCHKARFGTGKGNERLTMDISKTSEWGTTSSRFDFNNVKVYLCLTGYSNFTQP